MLPRAASAAFSAFFSSSLRETNSNRKGVQADIAPQVLPENLRIPAVLPTWVWTVLRMFIHLPIDLSIYQLP
jgi:hypothetical protein